MTAQKELLKNMKKLREQNPQFDNLVSQIDTKFERYIENFKSTPLYLEHNHQHDFFGLHLILIVPYLKISNVEHSYLTTYLQKKYKKFGYYFLISKII